MKQIFLDIIEKALDAYNDEHIDRYINEVEENGLKEHGFPRLCANIGILLSYGRKKRLMPRFLHMMDICCDSFTRKKAANDFSVKEIIFCILELERSGVVSKERCNEWRELLRSIDPYTCYNVIATDENDKTKFNWALFTAVSEYMRGVIGLADTNKTVDTQIATQLYHIDENGMYMDPNQPIVYDLVPRGLFSVLLYFGYNGKYKEVIDELLRKAGLFTLMMQSACGEIAYGGRSNQFIHNEAHFSIVCEFEARRYKAEGDLHKAGLFKAASLRSIESALRWLNKAPILHVKNRFPLESGYGCEDYAYFDKYMITAASFFYVAGLISDDSIKPVYKSEPFSYRTAPAFHQTFLYAGDYSIQYDTSPFFKYDCGGIGRIHRRGAPTTICLSVPCPSHPNYKIDDGAENISLCAGFGTEGNLEFTCDEGCLHEISPSHSADMAYLVAEVVTRGGYVGKLHCSVGTDGVTLAAEGDRIAAIMLPVLEFDGEKSPVVTVEPSRILIRYEGWICQYETDGRIGEVIRKGGNRNGRYCARYVYNQEKVRLRVQIYEDK